VFAIKEVDGRCEILPATAWSQSGFGVFVLGSMFCLYLSAMFSRRADEGIALLALVAVPLAVSALLLWQATRYWRLRRTPFIVERDGRIHYGELEPCPAGSARAVRIAPDPTAEHGDCKVAVELAGGSLVPLPLPYFGAISHRAVARSLAGDLARALKVRVLETH
jgi:hypothetical protein